AENGKGLPDPVFCKFAVLHHQPQFHPDTTTPERLFGFDLSYSSSLGPCHLLHGSADDGGRTELPNDAHRPLRRTTRSFAPMEAYHLHVRRSLPTTPCRQAAWQSENRNGRFRYCGTFFQSSRNRAIPMSVSGCFHSDGNSDPGMVAISAPITAACCTWWMLRTLATMISVLKP